MLSEHRIKLAMGQMLLKGGRLQDNVARAVEMIAQAGRQGCQIAVLPECLDLGWAHPAAGQLAAEIPGPATAMLGQAASDARLHVVAGLPVLHLGRYSRNRKEYRSASRITTRRRMGRLARVLTSDSSCQVTTRSSASPKISSLSAIENPGSG